MSNFKSVALVGLMAGAAAVAGTAFAANAAPTTPHEMKLQCEKDAKAKGLTGDALKAALKKCAEDNKPKK